MTPEAFMVAEGRNGFAWGRDDCVHTVDRWCVSRGKPSFVSASGYDFASETEAEHMAERRPMPIWVSRAMRKAGYVRTAAPQIGDVGIITDDGTLVAVAVRSTLGWLFRTHNGLTCYGPYARVLAAWSVD